MTSVPGAGGRLDRGGGAYGGDLSAPDRNGFRFGMIGIHRHYPAAEQHQVGGPADVRRLGAAAKRHEKRGGKREKGQQTHGIPPGRREA